MHKSALSLDPRRASALAAIAFLAILAGCGSSDDDLQILRTCGNGQVESGEECDDGGACAGGLNPGGRCLIGQADACPGSTFDCSFDPAIAGTCFGGPTENAACTSDATCCPLSDPNCGADCVGDVPGSGGFCEGGPHDGDLCGRNDDCCESPDNCGVCLGTCSGGPNDGGTCAGDSACTVADGACTLVDSDSCTSICRLPTCGDGAVNPGLEQCDGFDLNGAGCETLGLGRGILACSDTCRFDAAQCGPPFTATPTDTPLPTATATPTVTHTFLPGVTPPTATPTQTLTPSPTSTPDDGPECGNGLLEPGENFVDPNPVIGTVGDQNGELCEEDAAIQNCQASSAQFVVQVSLTDLPLGITVTGISIFTGYRSEAISIPGSALAGSVRQRIQLQVPASSFFPNDRDFGLRALMTGTENINEGPFATITFDVCEGAEPTLEDISCIVESATGPGGTITEPSACEITEVE